MKLMNIFWMATLLLLLVNVSFAFEVETLNGETIEWEESFCLEDPANYRELVGDDYYSYCESDFSEEYNEIPEDLADEIMPLVIIDANESNLEIETIDKDLETPVQNEEEDFIFEGDDIRGDNWPLFLGIAGIVLLFVIITLIIAHHFAKKRDEKKQILNLTPYLNNLRKKGYTENQLEEMLIKRGYDSAFINVLLNRK